jgi:hypothetical protein
MLALMLPKRTCIARTLFACVRDERHSQRVDLVLNEGTLADYVFQKQNLQLRQMAEHPSCEALRAVFLLWDQRVARNQPCFFC